MRIRSSKTLVYSQVEGQMLACNFLTRQVFECSRDVLDLLARIDDFTDLDTLASLYPELEAHELEDAIQSLIDMSAVVAEGSPEERSEAEFSTRWQWGVPAALLHFSLQDRPYIALDEAEDMQRQKLASEGHVELYESNDRFADIVRLPDPLSNNPLLALMARRRSVRMSKPESVTLKQISDCLFAGLGITGETENCTGRLPLKMTPSGGARNPYEAYVLVRHAEGLAPGIYHYAAIDHTLGRMGDLGEISFADLIGGQEWGDEMGVMILLVARLERTMWKYQDANAYRVVMIEAGHIGQNVMLSATEHGLSCCPTGALNHSLARETLGITDITHTPVYALSLSVPDHARAAAARRRFGH